jgi:FMN reductase
MRILRPERVRSPLVVGVGGSSRAGSGTDLALLMALREAETAGATTRFFGGEFLSKLPHFDPVAPERTPEQEELVAAVRACDGLLIASPSYHGNVSSLVKNAIDLFEDLATHDRPYLDGRAVGCIVTGAGAQAGGVTLAALRGMVHALRGWPTPLGVALNTSTTLFGVMGGCSDQMVAGQLRTLSRQVVEFALSRIVLEEVFRPLPGLRLVE